MKPSPKILLLTLLLLATIPAKAAILSVCPTGCDYTTVGAAYTAAIATDIIELRADIADEAVDINKNIAELRGDRPGRRLNATGNGTSQTLQIFSGLNQTLVVRNLEIDHSAGSANTVEITSLGTVGQVLFRDCLLKHVGGDIVFNSEPGSAVDQLVFERCRFIGGSSGDGVDVNAATATGFLRIQNCVFENFGGVSAGIMDSSGVATPVISVYHSVFHNNPGYGILLQSRGDFRNNIFTGNVDDILVGGSGSLADFTFNAFEQAAEALPGSNLTAGVTAAGEFVNAAGGDFHLLPTALARNSGDNSVPVTDDFDMVARPLEGTTDMGAFEFTPAPPADPTCVGLDSSFGSPNGFVTQDNAAGGSFNDYVYAVAWDGGLSRLYAAGESWNGANYDAVVWAFDASGGPDTLFGTGGKVFHDRGGNDSWRSIVLDAGKVVVAGASHNGTDNDMAITRYTSAGGLDATFNTGSPAYFDYSVTNEFGNALIRHPDGDYVVAGQLNGGLNWDMMLWKVAADGTGLNTNFNTPWGYLFDHGAAGGNGDDYGYGVAVDSDGNLYVAGGSADVVATSDMVVWKLDAEGQLHAGFGSGGIVTHNSAAGGNGWDIGWGVALDSRGRPVVGGSSEAAGAVDRATLWRLQPDGTLDPGFAGGSTYFTTTDGRINSVAVDSRDRIVAAGYIDQATRDTVIFKVLADGNWDLNWGGLGAQTHHNAAGGNSSDQAWALALDGDLEFFVGGDSTGASNLDMALWNWKQACAATATATPTPTGTPTPSPTPTCIPNGIFGKNIQGGTYNGFPEMEGTLYTLAQESILTAIYVDIESIVVGDMTVAVYDDSGAGGGPGNLMVSLNSQSVFNGWETFDIADTQLPAGNYWLMWQRSGSITVYHDPVAVGDEAYFVNTFDTFPDPAPAANLTGNKNWSIYADFETCSLGIASTFTPTPTGTPTATASPTANGTFTATPTPTGSPTPSASPTCVATTLNLNAISKGGNTWNAAWGGIDFTGNLNKGLTQAEGITAVGPAGAQAWFAFENPDTGGTITGATLYFIWGGNKAINGNSVDVHISGDQTTTGPLLNTILNPATLPAFNTITAPLPAPYLNWDALRNLRMWLNNTSAGGSPATKEVQFEHVYVLINYIPDCAAGPSPTPTPGLSCDLIYPPAQNANLVTGQTDFPSNAADQGGAAGANTLDGPKSVWTDGTRMIVSDANNHRVLIYNNLPLVNDTAANLVLGQADFTGQLANRGGAFAAVDTLNNPNEAVIIDGKLLVADRGNHRVLIWNSIPTANGQPADLVIGQPDMVSLTINNGGLSSQSLNGPQGLAYDGQYLFVADNGNNRVLVYNGIPTANFAHADMVIGQPGFFLNTANQGIGTFPYTLAGPWDVAVYDRRLFISDSNNHRVLIYNQLPARPNASADIVVGQPSMLGNAATLSQTGLNTPGHLFTEGARLYVADWGNNRAMVWNSIPVADGAAANVVVGQTDFVTNCGICSGGSVLYQPLGIAATNQTLLVSQAGMHKVFHYNCANPATPTFTTTITPTPTMTHTPPAPPTATPEPASGSGSTVRFPVTNGQINDIAVRNNLAYVTGDFTWIGPRTGTAVNFMLGDQINLGFPEISGGSVSSIVSDGNGGWFIGGNFTHVAGLARANVAHVHSNGSFDADWVPALANVNALVLSVDRQTLYAATTTGIVEVNTSTSAAGLWGPTPSPSSGVIALGIANGHLYLGGNFTNYDGQGINRLARVNLTDESLDTNFNPNPDGTVYAFDFSSDQSRLYVGGAFFNIDATTRNYLANIDALDGTVLPWSDAPGATVYAVKVAGPNLLIGGVFGSVGVASRDSLALVNPATGTAVLGASFTFSTGGDVRSIALGDPGKAYIGGTFNTIDGQTRGNIAEIDFGAGASIVTAWAGNACDTVNVINNDNGLVAGGVFGGANCLYRERVAAVDTDNGVVLASFNNSPGPSNAPAAVAVSPDGANIYLGGSSDLYGLNMRFAKLDATGTVLSQYQVNGSVLDIEVYGTAPHIAYAVGNFADVNAGTPRGDGFAISEAWVLQAWNPQSNGVIEDLEINAGGNAAWIGGTFTSAGGGPQDNIAALNLATGNSVLAVAAGTDGIVYDIEFSSDDSVLYVGGTFASLAGSAGYSRLGAIDRTSGTLVAGFNPSVNNTVFAVDEAGGNVYMGGLFTLVNATGRNRAAAVDAAGINLSWAPAVSGSNQIDSLKLTSDGNTLLWANSGGSSFHQVNLMAQQFLGAVVAEAGVAWTPTNTPVPTDTPTQLPSPTPTPTFGDDVIAGPIVVNGIVYALTSTASTTYIGGQFTLAGPRTGFAVPVDDITGAINGGFAQLAASDVGTNAVFASAPDGNGGWYWGGRFTFAAGQNRVSIAHVLANGALDPNFNHTISGAGDTIEAMVVDPATGVLFIGGNFTAVDAVPRNYLAAFGPSGSMNGWNPDVNGFVNDLLLDGSNIYVTGNFTSVNVGTLPQARNRAAAFDKSTGVETGWNPNLNGSGLAIAADPNWIYLGGAFTSLNGDSLGRVNKTIGTVDATWIPAPGGTIIDEIAVDGSKIYVGGGFTNAFSTGAENYIAELNNSNGNANAAFNVNINGDAEDIIIHNGKVYFSGPFTTVNGQPRNSVAAVDALGNLQSWNPSPSDQVESLSAYGSQVMLGGSFRGMNMVTRNNVCAVDAAGNLTSWNPNADNTVQDLVVIGSQVYLGGNFSNVGGVTRNLLAAVDTNGNLLGFNPTLDGNVTALGVHTGSLVVGGTFLNIAGSGRTRLALFTNNVIQSWDPGANGTVETIISDGSLIYVGGSFSFAGGLAYDRLVRIDGAGNGDVTWNPAPDNTVFALAHDGTDLYAGGAFNNIGGQSRSYVAQIDNSGAATAFNAQAGGTVVRALSYHNGKLFVGGNFTSMGSGFTSRTDLARLDPANAAADPWIPALEDGTVNALAGQGDSMHVGGNFRAADQMPHQGWAQIGIAAAGTPTPTYTFSATPTTTPTPTITATATLQVNARSIGTNAGALYSTGDATVAVGSKVVTLGAGANLPANVGRGDEIVLGVSDPHFIESRDSSSQVTLQQAAIVPHTNDFFVIRRAFTDFQAAETARDGDLVGENRIEEFVVYNDGSFFEPASKIYIDGSITDAEHYMRFYAAPGQRHTGVPNTGAILDAGTINPAGGGLLHVADEYVRIEGLEFSQDTSNLTVGITVTSNNTTIEGCLFHGVLFWGINITGSNNLVRNNFFLNGSAASPGDGPIHVDLPAGGALLYNNSFFGRSQGHMAVATEAGTSVSIINCVALGYLDQDFNLEGAVGQFEYNAFTTVAGFTPGSFGGNNVTPHADPALEFVSVIPGSENLHLITGTTLVNAGSDLSGTGFSGDIDGDSRPIATAWEIGADEAAVFAATATATSSPTATPTPSPTVAPTLAGLLGNRSAVELISSTFLDAPAKRLAFRFTQTSAKNVVSVHLRVDAITGTSPFYLVGIQADLAGQPDGTWLAGGSLVTQLSAGWNTIPLGCVLSAATVYHIVVEHDSGTIDSGNRAWLASGSEPRHGLWPKEQLFDPAAEVLLDTGGGWTSQGRMPQMAVEYSDSTALGNPYMSNGGTFLRGAEWRSQVFDGPVTEAAQVNWVGAVVEKNGVGIPLDDLRYQLWNLSDNQLLDSGVLWAQSDAAIGTRWVDAPLSQPVTFAPGKQYRLIFESAGSGLSDNYQIYFSDEFYGQAFQQGLTYGGLSAYREESGNSGSVWNGPLLSQDHLFRFSWGSPETPTPSSTATATLSASPTITYSPTITATSTPSPTASPSATATPCADLIVSGFTNLPAGTYNYCNVHVQSGGTLSIGEAVILNISGDLTLDVGGQIDGMGAGYMAGMGPGSGFPGGPGTGGGGGGHGGSGGMGGGAPGGPGGLNNDDPAAPMEPGSGGANGDPGPGGWGGGALIANVTGGAYLYGSISMNGMMGGPGGLDNTGGGGGGAGGTIYISADEIHGNGFLSANGGSGGSDFANLNTNGGGGGGGGMINLCATSLYNFTGVSDILQGAPGTGTANPGMDGMMGTVYSCGDASLPPATSPTFSVSPTFSASPSFSATPSASETFTASPSATSTNSPGATQTHTPSNTPSVTPTATPTSTSTATETGTPSDTTTATSTASASYSPSPSPTPSPSATPAPPLVGYFGHQSVAGLTFSYFLNSPTAKVAFRFTADQANTVTAIRVRVQTLIGIPPSYRAGIQGESGANTPNGAWISGGGPQIFTPVGGWNVVGGLSASLTPGQVYYVVVEYDSGQVDGSNYAFFQHGTQPRHGLVPFDQRADGSLEALATNNGSSWSVSGRHPEFTLDYADASSFGCPYFGVGANSVYGANTAGELFRYTGVDASVDSLGLWVRRGGSAPADDIYFSLQNLTLGQTLAGGLLQASGASSNTTQWVEAPLGTSVTLQAGHDYRVWVFSPGSTAGTPWYLEGGQTENTAYYHDLTYDGALSWMQLSSDSGSSWPSNLYQMDAGFRLSSGVPATPTHTITRTTSPSPTISPTGTLTASPTSTSTFSPSATFTGSATATPTSTPSASPTPTPSATPTPVSIMITDESGLESGGNLVFTIMLSATQAQDTFVDWATSDGLAQAATGDYTGSSGTLTITAGTISSTIVIALGGDSLDETDEDFFVTLSNPVNASFGDSVGIGTINDDDAPPSVSFDTSASSGPEATSPVLVGVSLDAPSGLTVSVEVAVTSGTATGGGTDYSYAGEILTFAPGETSKNISIAVMDESLVEGNETVEISLSNANNSSLGAAISHTYTILNDDAPTATPSATPTATPTSTATASPSSTPSATPSATETATSTWTPTITETDTPTATQSFTPTLSGTSSHTKTHTSTATPTFTETATPTITETITPTTTKTITETATPSITETGTPSVTETITETATSTWTPTITETDTPTATDTSTPTASPSASPSATPTCVAMSLFGNDKQGRFAWVGGGDAASANRHTLDEDSTISAVAMHVAVSGGQIRAAIYSDNAGVPENLVIQSTSQATVNGWNLLAVPATFLAAGDYWIAIQAQSGVQISHENGIIGEEIWDSVTFGSFPASWGSTNQSGFIWSAYALTCPVSGFTPTPTPVPATCDAAALGNTVWEDNSYFTQTAADLESSRITVGTGGWATDMGIAIWSSAGKLARLGIYSEAAGAPDALLSESTSFAVANGWNTVDIPDIYLTPGNYWLAWNAQVGTEVMYRTGVFGDEAYRTGVAFGSLPPAFGSATIGDWRWNLVAYLCPGAPPTPTPSATETGTLSVTATITSSPTATASPSLSPTPSRTITGTATGTATRTSTPTATSSATETITWSSTPTSTASRTATGTATETITQTASPSVTETTTPSVTGTDTPTWSATPTSSPTWTATTTSSFTSTPTATWTETTTPTWTTTQTQTVTPTWTPTITSSPTATASPSLSPTPSQTITGTATGTATGTSTPTATSSATETSTWSSTPTETNTSTSTASRTATGTITGTITWSPSPTSSATATATGTATTTITLSETPTVTLTWSPTYTDTGTSTPTATITESSTQTRTQTFTPTVTLTASPSYTPTATLTSTATSSPSATVTPSATPSATTTFTTSASPTPTPTATSTFTSTLSNTSTNTETYTSTATPSVTYTATYTITLTHTPLPSATSSYTGTPTSTETSTSTPLPTATDTYTHTPTYSVTLTNTPLPSATHTYTPTPSYTDSPTPGPSPTHTPTYTITLTPLPTQTPEVATVLDKNIFKPTKGGTLTISFKALSDGEVEVKVYNLAAELVQPVWKGPASRGLWIQATWDGRNLRGEMVASGVFFVSVKGAGIDSIRKVILLK